MLTSSRFARIGRSCTLGLFLARHSFAGPTPLARAQLIVAMSRAAEFDHRRNFDLLGLPDLSARLPELSLPVTVLSGLDDPATSVEDAVNLADHLGCARLRLLAKTGHMLPLERPEAVATELIDLCTEGQFDAAS
jgi:pimeloyl-ACP methyl ester carboxylesterase